MTRLEQLIKLSEVISTSKNINNSRTFQIEKLAELLKLGAEPPFIKKMVNGVAQYVRNPNHGVAKKVEQHFGAAASDAKKSVYGLSHKAATPEERKTFAGAMSRGKVVGGSQ
jgi:hypothetical protein